VTALIQLGKRGKIGNRPGVRNPMVAAVRAFPPRQPVKREHVVYGPKGAARFRRQHPEAGE
jgi:hypothetical protein